MEPNQLRELQRLTKSFKAPCLLPRRKRTLWAQPHMVRPALVKEKFGNGKLLIGIAPIMHRPCYYLVWIDDRWNLDNCGAGPLLIDHLDDIWEAIGEEFGSRDPDSEEYHWPEEDSGGGCGWWQAGLSDVLPKRARQRLAGRAHG